MKRFVRTIAIVVALILGVSTPTLAQMVSGTVNAKQSGTWNITNISGTVSLPTGAATEGSLAKLTLTQGSTTSGQSGPLIQGAVTTSAPTYTTGQTSPLSLTTGGLLRVDASGTTVPTTQGALTSIVTGQQAVTATAVALPSNSAKQVCIKVLMAGTQTVYFGPSGVTTSTGQELSPGDAACLALDNTNRIYVIAGGTGSTVAFYALN